VGNSIGPGEGSTGGNEMGSGGGVLFLGDGDVARLLEVEPMLDALEGACASFSRGDTSVPPRVAAVTEGGMLAAMPGFVAGTGLGLKAISIFPANHARGIPSHQGLILLFDDATGTPLCVMDAARVTAMRTAGMSAVATRLLARPHARTLAIVGSGVQAAAHLAVVSRVRAFGHVRVAGRDPVHVRAVTATHPGATVAASIEEAVRGADVVCCCTDARDPVIQAAWLSPGAHVVSVGTGHELDPATVTRGRVFLEWRGAAASAPPAGARELQGLDPEQVTELGEVILGRRPGRMSPEEITVYKSTGHAMEDIAAARLVYDRAIAEGVGQRLAL
jgi:alanine dehydrogenase